MLYALCNKKVEASGEAGAGTMIHDLKQGRIAYIINRGHGMLLILIFCFPVAIRNNSVINTGYQSMQRLHCCTQIVQNTCSVPVQIR